MTAKVLDIRTPAEVAEGKLDGSIVVDFRSPDFVELISQLDKSADYIMHCRSGGRVSEAIPLMRELGFTGDLTNAGGIDDAAALTSLPIVNE
jgi:rhodanese-related sulfurtransferase